MDTSARLRYSTVSLQKLLSNRRTCLCVVHAGCCGRSRVMEVFQSAPVEPYEAAVHLAQPTPDALRDRRKKRLSCVFLTGTKNVVRYLGESSLQVPLLTTASETFDTYSPVEVQNGISFHPSSSAQPDYYRQSPEVL